MKSVASYPTTLNMFHFHIRYMNVIKAKKRTRSLSLFCWYFI